MASCTIVAAGSTFTRPSPSRKRGFDVHCRRSWVSACMTPMIAGPPYAVVPILRKLVAISFHVAANDSVIESHLGATPRRACGLVDLRRHVAAFAVQARDLDVNAPGAHRHAEHTGPERLLLRVKPERALDRGDAVAER